MILQSANDKEKIVSLCINDKQSLTVYRIKIVR